MFAVRNLLRANTQIVKNVQQRNMSGIAIPPRNKVSKAEMIFLAGTMFVGWISIPTWVVLHIKNYRDKN